MKHTRLLLIASISSTILAGSLTAQSNNGNDRVKTYYGQSVKFGSGSARTYVTVQKDADAPGNHKVPLELGFEYPAAAVSGLDANEEQVFIVDLPQAARDTPFQYMMVDWNPHGHPGPMYLLPHFDFHFYIQDLDEVMAIDSGPCNGLDCEDFTRAMKPIPAAMMPQGYINVGAVEPKMGNHLVDPASPEYHGQMFTRTFFYGAYDGKISFYEPMITRAWLEQEKPTAATGCVNLKLAQEYAESGYYPTQYCAVYHPETSSYRISLNNFVWRTAPTWATSSR